LSSKKALLELKENSEKEENNDKNLQAEDPSQQVTVQFPVLPHKSKHAHLINMQEIEEQVEEEEKDSPKKGNGKVEVDIFHKSEEQSQEGNLIHHV
jgi:hypothetical protein